MSSEAICAPSSVRWEEGVVSEEQGDVAIRVRGLGKCYHVYEKPGDRLKQFIAPRLRSVFKGLKSEYYREFWALSDVSFDVAKGEVVGIVGRNGSGKSTLLQIIAGTLTPTRGEVSTAGRVAALLELGSGFNPEFTGRENIYLNGAVLGLSREEIDASIEEIVAFADIGLFIDQPIKTYSSGRGIRLAFSIAITVEPDILIVDEALSVGDELFQRKCFSRIEALKNGGATILFVSHSGAAVVELCDRAVFIDDGELICVGAPKAVVGGYQKLLYAPGDTRQSIRQKMKHTPISVMADVNGDIAGESPALADALEEYFDSDLVPQSTIVYESHGASILSPWVSTDDGVQVNCLRRRQTYRYSYLVRFDRPAANVHFGMLIKTPSGMELGGASTAAGLHTAIPYVPAGSVVKVEFNFRCNLNPGVYFLNAGVVGAIDGNGGFLHRIVDACMFRVLPVADNKASSIVDFDCVSTVTIDTDADLRLAEWR